ncbi:Hypothetical predicted protein [Paramuricea clavata]|uniref:Uncharacterized protein n=1 Tax=Paramuricea clavata TaxID=317549 RepID=A0A6S7KPJ4_PARCT|nr:Hypothetical predicted protein [Paramuricea clavata]
MLICAWRTIVGNNPRRFCGGVTFATSRSGREGPLVGELNSDDDSTSEEIQEHNNSSSDGEKRRDDMEGCRLTEDNVVKESPQTKWTKLAESRDGETTHNERSKTTTVSVEQPLNDDQLSNDEETMDSGT